MNNQLSTLAETKQIASLLGTLGGGVANTYIPEYDGPYGAPSMGESKFYHFTFADGADGFNVGLIRALMSQCPTSWPIMLATEINYQSPAIKASAGDVKATTTPVPIPVLPINVVFPAINSPLKPGQFMSPFGPALAAVHTED